MNFCRRRSAGSQSTSRKCVCPMVRRALLPLVGCRAIRCFSPAHAALGLRRCVGRREAIETGYLPYRATQKSRHDRRRTLPKGKFKAALRDYSHPVGTAAARTCIGHRRQTHYGTGLEIAQHVRSSGPVAMFQDTTRGATTAEVVQSALTVLSSVGNGHDPELVARDDEAMERTKVFCGLRGQCDSEDRTDPPAVPTARNSPLPLEGLLVQASAFVRTHAREDVDGIDAPDDLHSVVIASADQQGYRRSEQKTARSETGSGTSTSSLGNTC